MPIKSKKRIADQFRIGISVRKEIESPWASHESIHVSIWSDERDDVIDRIAPDKVPYDICLTGKKTSTDGVRRHAEVEEFTPIIELPGPLGERDTVGV